MSHTSEPNSGELFKRFPMGPKIRAWLGVTEPQYEGVLNDAPSADEQDAFQSRMIRQMEDATVVSGQLLADLLEELVGMNVPLCAIRLADAYPDMFLHDDFRSQLHLGNACMLAGELARAEACFREAQKIVPEEPAPYVNLAQIYGEDRHFDTALTWCLAGLDADKNFLRLWELLAWIYQQLDFTSAREKVRAQAALRQSWAGASLAVDLFAASEDEPDGRAKMLALDPFYIEGLRDVDFLVEYTAALGMAGHYDKIPTVLWQVESQATTGLPWQLYFHAIQAYLGLARDDEALALIERTAKLDGVPPQIRTQLDGLRAEAQGTKH